MWVLPGDGKLTPGGSTAGKFFLVEVKDGPPLGCLGCALPGFPPPRLRPRAPKRAKDKLNNPVRATTTEMNVRFLVQKKNRSKSQAGN